MVIIIGERVIDLGKDEMREVSDEFFWRHAVP